MPRRINYKLAAVVGAVAWVLIAMCFGGWLLDHGLTWEKPTFSQQVAVYLFLILCAPFFIFIEDPIVFPFNGAFWGLVVAFVYNKISARWGGRKH